MNIPTNLYIENIIMNFDQNMKKMKADLENLVLKIPKFSQPVLGFHSPEKDWNVQINKMANRYSNLLNDAEMSQDYFFAMANLEKDCSKMINSILSQLDHDKKLSTMSGRLNTLNDLNQVIKSINLLMSQHIDFVISNSKRHAPDIKQWRQLEDISRSIQINTNIISPLLGGNQAGINNLDQIAQQASRLILAALAGDTINLNIVYNVFNVFNLNPDGFVMNLIIDNTYILFQQQL